MKKIHYLVIVILFTLSACKKERNKSMTIERACEGTYLKLEGKDYRVCNEEKIASYSNGEQLKVTFKKIDDCPGYFQENPCPAIYHPNEGWIEILKVK